ncbi:hypothetical protein [Pandoraea sputorum]|uniref:hypothetical protein n=1 Tax=Pandoraea sputorum TaxID=93222 RepID=UPI00125C490B|nr:hypothetical protein [Pandoraea sputorum]VVE55290.1 hypothetical protein PSP20601_04974 [Pandoraea sputorum]
MAKQGANFVGFNFSNGMLAIKTTPDEFRNFGFKEGIAEEEKNEFIESLKNDDVVAVSREKLLTLFDVSETVLPEVNGTKNITVLHGPGQAHLYFENHKYPDDFLIRSLKRNNEEWIKNFELMQSADGILPIFEIGYENKQKIIDTYNHTVERYFIRDLKSFPQDQQITLIAGFISEVEHMHFFTDSNNRIWTQILLNHLLEICDLPNSILPVPNGFASAVRYLLHTHNAPGTPGYVQAMRPAIDAIEDGMKYYRSICKPT